MYHILIEQENGWSDRQSMVIYLARIKTSSTIDTDLLCQYTTAVNYYEK